MAKREAVHVGMRVGKWEVLAQADGDRWLAKCECGVEKEIKDATLKYGRTGSCISCVNRSRRADLVGKKFGLWTVTDNGGSGENVEKAFCECECGNSSWIQRSKLVGGHSTMCRSCSRRVVGQASKGKPRSQKSLKPTASEMPFEGRTRYNWKVLKLNPSNGSNICHWYYCECLQCGDIKSIKYGDFKKARCHNCQGKL